MDSNCEICGVVRQLDRHHVIPKRSDIENIPKLDVYAKLKKATADLEETYQKKHAFEILALVDPQKLNDPTNSPQAHRLIEFMENLS